MSSPDFLFHYTSISALAYILKSKKLRFNNLKSVDDITEGKNQDIKALGNYIFISCWTDLEEESIPFWHMYTENMSGVRLKINSNPFKTYNIKLSREHGMKKGFTYEQIIPQEHCIHDNYWIAPDIKEKGLLRKIKYTSEPQYLNPKIKKYDNNISKDYLELNDLGEYKTHHWEFQSEWRYILRIFPRSKEDADIISNASNLLLREKPIPIKEIYAELDSDCIKNMEIVLGPRHTTAERIIVESLVEKYLPTAIIKKSVLTGKIR